MTPDEMIIAPHFFIRFLRSADDGATEIVDRYHAEMVEIVRRNPDGTDGETVTVQVK